MHPEIAKIMAHMLAGAVAMLAIAGLIWYGWFSKDDKPYHKHDWVPYHGPGGGWRCCKCLARIYDSN